MIIESRQVRRQNLRANSKLQKAHDAAHARVLANKARLARQSEREKAGYYDEQTSVASVLTPSRSRLDKRRVKKGQFSGRVISTDRYFGREIQYHATKGFRSYRIA